MNLVDHQHDVGGLDGHGADSAAVPTPLQAIVDGIEVTSNDSGDRNASTLGLEQEDRAKRMFRRRSMKHLADYTLEPAVRSENGAAPARAVAADHGLPTPGQLREKYMDSLELVAKYAPLRAAALDDVMGRAEQAVATFREVQREEEERLQNYNEDVRRADLEIDSRVRQLQAERAAVQVVTDAEIARWTKELDNAREEAAVAQVMAGLPVHGLDDKFLDTDVPVVAIDSSSGAGGTGYAADPVAPVMSGPAELSSTKQPFTAIREAASAFLNRSKPQEHQPEATSPRMAGPHGTPSESMTPRYSGSSSETSFVLRSDVFPPDIVPTEVAFPMEEGLQQAPPEAKIAVDEGLVGVCASEAMLRQHSFGTKAARTLALIACGSIFGVSVGLVMDVLNIQVAQLDPQSMLGPLLVVVSLGIALFWVLGRVVSTLASLASEERYTAILAQYRSQRIDMGNWMRTASKVTIGVLIVAVVVLVVIEANVEKSGIVNTFLERARDSQIGQGNVAGSRGGGLSNFLGWVLGLVASVPFVLFHASEAWVEARSRTIATYLSSRREAEAWDIAKRKYDRDLSRTESHAAKHSAFLQEEHAIVVRAMRHARHNSQADVAVYGNSQPLEQTSSSPATTNAVEPPSIPADVLCSDSHATLSQEGWSDYRYNSSFPLAGYGDMPRSGERGSTAQSIRDIELKSRVALAQQRARTAWQRRREAWGQRNEAVSWHDKRIAQVESQRLQERPDLDERALRRIDGAYNVCLASLRNFDEARKRELRRVERLEARALKGGVVYRGWDWVAGKPEQSAAPNATEPTSATSSIGRSDKERSTTNVRRG